MAIPRVIDVRYEKYRPGTRLGLDEQRPRLSWRFVDTPPNFEQEEFELEVSRLSARAWEKLCTHKVTSPESVNVPWPLAESANSREQFSTRVRARGRGFSDWTAWSEPSILEVGLLNRSDWSSCRLITAPWAASNKDGPQPEDLFRLAFDTKPDIRAARLYITAFGLYEVEINGKRVGDHFLAPGWTSYAGRLQYQTYDVTEFVAGRSCIGIRVAEGWYSGRLGFEGGRRNIWGVENGVLAQVEITYHDGSTQVLGTDEAWLTTRGPIRLAEIYDGEKYDATIEVDGWSYPGTNTEQWQSVQVRPLPADVHLTAGYAEPVRRIEVVAPLKLITTPSGKLVLDFGQNLVGYVRIKHVQGGRCGDQLRLSHAEVLDEQGELSRRPLRHCEAQDIYTMKGDPRGESYEPRFTFHGFRYVQLDGWPGSESSLCDSVEAVVCHSDFEPAGDFSCSDSMLSQLFTNIRWSMRGNFVSVPTDCPQRDERLGYSGDLALFAPTAVLLYKCYPFLQNWLVDVTFDQEVLGGNPPIVSPNALYKDPVWGHVVPFAIWHDVTILAPWILYQETGDDDILRRQYQSMVTWLKTIPRNQKGSTRLWDFQSFQLGDWLDPNAPPDHPGRAMTDPILVANAFLIQSLDIMVQIAHTLHKAEDETHYQQHAAAARVEFSNEYISKNGRMVSDSQTAYALAICFDLLDDASQINRAGNRLAEIVRKNSFKIGTGFAGTPFVCKALVKAGYSDIAYAMLLNTKCPSWLYPVTMGATTMWERWDSMRPDHSVNPGDMTSFNHYAFGAVGSFLFEHVAGLQRVSPGWKRSRVAPVLGGELTSARADHLTPYGRVASAWVLEERDNGVFQLIVDVVVPPGTQMEVVLPAIEGDRVEVVGSGEWTFKCPYKRQYTWPVEEISFVSM